MPVLNTAGSISLKAFGFSSYPIGSQIYTTPGTYSWQCPPGVTSVCVVCVGATAGSDYLYSAVGGSVNGAGGAGLGYKNNIPVVPGSTYTVVVGAGGTPAPNQNVPTGTSGGDSYFIGTSTVKGGGSSSYSGGTYTGDGGGNGGNGGAGSRGGGGGAGGYSGNGGNGGSFLNNGSNGSGGSAGGGAGGNYISGNERGGAGGGGVGLLGSGSSGTGGVSVNGSASTGGTGGSNGGTGASGSAVGDAGGGGAAYGGGTANHSGGSGLSGAVRIIWGAGRSFPSNAA